MDLVDSSLTARPAPAAPSQTDSTSQPPVTTRNGAAQGTTASASGITARAAANSRQKAYAVADIMARYRFNPHAELSLNVDNLFNKHYRTQPDRHSYGALRTVNAAFTYRFK